LEQDRDYARFQEQLKLMKKEVSGHGAGLLGAIGPSWHQRGCERLRQPHRGLCPLATPSVPPSLSFLSWLHS
jgi:hypothetical protein